MANKRQFKKSVDALSSALVDEMMASLYNVKEADEKKINQAIAKVASAMMKAREESNVHFDKVLKDFSSMVEYNKAKAAFTKEKYAKAIQNYNDALGEALKLYNEAMPQNQVEQK